MAAGGGEPTVLTRPDRARGENDHFWPEFLPGGQAVLFTIMATTGGLDQAQVAVLDLRTGTHKTLIPGGSDAHYVLERPSGVRRGGDACAPSPSTSPGSPSSAPPCRSWSRW